MSRSNYLKATAIVVAEILVGLHKTSSNPICLSFQSPASAKCQFAEMENVQNVNFKPLSIFCSFVMAISSEFSNLNQCFLGEQKATLPLMPAAKKSPKFPVNPTKKLNFATSNEDANFDPLSVIIPFTSANVAYLTTANHN